MHKIYVLYYKEYMSLRSYNHDININAILISWILLVKNLQRKIIDDIIKGFHCILCSR